MVLEMQGNAEAYRRPARRIRGGRHSGTQSMGTAKSAGEGHVQIQYLSQNRISLTEWGRTSKTERVGADGILAVWLLIPPSMAESPCVFCHSISEISDFSLRL